MKQTRYYVRSDRLKTIYHNSMETSENCFLLLFHKNNRKCFLCVSIELTLVKVWENSKLLWNHSLAARVSLSPKLHSCYHNSMVYSPITHVGTKT